MTVFFACVISIASYAVIDYLIRNSRSLLAGDPSVAQKSTTNLLAIFAALITGVITAFVVNFNFSRGYDISGSVEQWGQMGDFFGGMLNPILAFASFIALLYTIRIQSEELRLTREELRMSVLAQGDMAKSQSESVKIQSETAELNRSIAEFEYLSSAFQVRSKAASYLLYEYTQPGEMGGQVFDSKNGLWFLYSELKKDIPIEKLRENFKLKVRQSMLRVNIETLRLEVFLIGKIIDQLGSNKHFKGNVDALILESQRFFIIIYIYSGETEFSGYSFDPKPYLDANKITYNA